MTEVSVVIPVHNGGDLLAATLESISAQDFTGEWECVVVDDASTDDTAALVAAFSRRDERFRLLSRAESGGPFAAANDGVSIAKGHWIVFTDGDDISPTNRLSLQIRFLKEHPHLRACTGAWRLLDEHERLGPPRSVPGSTAEVLKWLLCVRTGLVHSSLCVERSLMLELGGYAERRVAQDARLWCEVSRRNVLGVSDDVVVHWRRHGGQLSVLRADEQRYEATLALIDHLAALGCDWTETEVQNLQAIGAFRAVEPIDALRMLQKWESEWTLDTSLSDAGRHELERAAARFRLRICRPRRGLSATVAVRAAGGAFRFAFRGRGVAPN